METRDNVASAQYGWEKSMSKKGKADNKRKRKIEKSRWKKRGRERYSELKRGQKSEKTKKSRVVWIIWLEYSEYCWYYYYYYGYVGCYCSR